MKLAIVIALGVAYAAGTAYAQQYRWVDEKGRVQYTDTPPPSSAKGVQKKDLKVGKGSEVVPYGLASAMKDHPVTLYTHKTCIEPCQYAREVLNKRGVPFKETAVASNKDLADLKTLSGGNSVPVVTVGSRVETSGSEEAINAALDAAGYPGAGILPPRSQSAPAEGEKAPATAAKGKAAEAEAPRGPYSPGAPPPKPVSKPASKPQ